MSSPIPKSLYFLLYRRFSSLPRRRPNLSEIPWRHKSRAIRQAQQALTDYLHSTRSLPYIYAEHISNNSLVSLSNLISHIRFSPSDFSESLQKFLRYHPINEFEFFYESIGIHYDELPRILPANKLFFSEDATAFNAACALSAFGFPWNKLSTLYREDPSIFTTPSSELTSRLSGFKDYGFSNTSVVGVCLAFPYVLSGELGGNVAALFHDLKTLFVDFDLGSCVQGNVDAWYDICQKIRVFYDLNCEKGKVGDLMGKAKNIFLDYPLDVFVQTTQYFCRFGVRNEEVGLLLLQRPEILNFELETLVISVEGFLKHFGLGAKQLTSVAYKHSHVLGRNKMANLPHVMRAMDLHEWFFNKMRQGNHLLLASYAMSEPDEDLNKEFRDSLERIQGSRTPIHTMNKLAFMHGIGFGENALTVKVLAHLHGTSSELQERFDCLLRAGIVFSNLCTMIATTPKILNQKPDILEQKLSYFCQDMECSLQYLDIFPAFLCFNLENRIKPRHRFNMWLAEKGLCTDEYSIASLVATSEKNFMARLHKIHPDAPKHWLEFSHTKSPIMHEVQEI